MKHIIIIISFWLTFTTNISLANESQTNKGGTDIYVDGELITQITAKQVNNRLKLSHIDIKNIPPKEQWYSVVIKNSKGVILSFQNWQRHFKGKEIILSIVDNKQHIGLYNSVSDKPLYYQKNSKVIFIETKPIAIKQPKKLALPDLYITRGKKSTRLEHRHLGETGKHGWQLEYILNALNKEPNRSKTPISQFDLTCGDSTNKLSFSRAYAKLTYLKVNQRQQWRAVIIDDKSKSKNNWEKCRPLIDISLY